MNRDLPTWILEPELTEKQDLSAREFFKRAQKADLITEVSHIDDIKRQLKEVWEYARNKINIECIEIDRHWAEGGLCTADKIISE